MRAALLTRSRPAFAAVGERFTLEAVAALFKAYVAVLFAFFFVIALLVPYHFWDSLSFGEWSRLIAQHGDFHFPSVTAPDLQRPLFYVAQGWTWRIFGFHESLGRLLSLAFTALLAGSLALLARRPHRYGRLEAAIVLILLVSCPPFVEQALGGMSDMPTAALVAATGAALWLLRAGPTRFVLLVLLAAGSSLAKTTGLLGMGGLFLASLLGPWATLRARALADSFPIAIGTLVALVYYDTQAGNVGKRSVVDLLRAGTDTGHYAQVAADRRVDAVFGLHWLGSGHALPYLLLFTLLYAAVRLAGVAHRRAATAAALAGPVVYWVASWISYHETTVKVGPFESGRTFACVALLAVPLLLARECPDEFVPSRLGIARLVVWSVPMLAVWLHETPYATRLAAPAWPGLFLLIGASVLPAFVATARRAALAVAVPAAVLLAAAFFSVVYTDRLDGDSWSRLAALSAGEWFDHGKVRSAVAMPGFTDALAALRPIAGSSGRILTSSGEFRFFFPGRVKQQYARSCAATEDYSAFVLLADPTSTTFIRGSSGADDAASESYWLACRSPRLTEVASSGIYTVFRVRNR